MLNKYLYKDPFEDLFKTFTYGTSAVPPANIFALKDKYEIKLLVPGRSKADIRVAASKGTLSVSASAPQEDKTSYKEFVLGTFERRFSLPKDVDAESISASCENGVLSITLPIRAKEEAKQHLIEIN
jgi:HSP20 family protein